MFYICQKFTRLEYLNAEEKGGIGMDKNNNLKRVQL